MASSISRRALLALAPLPVLAGCARFWWWPVIARWEREKISGTAQIEALNQTYLLAGLVLAALSLWYGLIVWRPWVNRNPRLVPTPISPRQAWLETLAKRLRPAFARRIKRRIPSWPVRYDPSLWGLRGFCAYPETVGGPCITIGPLDRSEDVAFTLAHEWLHAAIPVGEQHGAAFQHLEDVAGMTAGSGQWDHGYGGRERSPEFDAWAAPILATLPPWPAETGEAPPHLDRTTDRWRPALEVMAVTLLIGVALGWRQGDRAPLVPLAMLVLWLPPIALVLAAMAFNRRKPVVPKALMGDGRSRGVAIPTPPFLTRSHFQGKLYSSKSGAFFRLRHTRSFDVGVMLRLIEIAALGERLRRGGKVSSDTGHVLSARLLPEYGFLVDEETQGGERIALVAYGLHAPVPPNESEAIQRQLGTSKTVYRPLLHRVRLGRSMRYPISDGLNDWTKPA